MADERLQKILAQAGIASRRAAEALIAEGRVRVNGRIVKELGTRADAHKDRIEVNGKRVVAEKPVYFVVNKPREVVTTMDDPEGRDSIKDLLRRIPERVYPVGRLDYHTSGVLLVTNDGELAQSLLHPRKQVPKTYVVKLRGHIGVPELDKLRNGVDIGEAQLTGKAEVFVLREDRGNTWLQMTIKEGRNRQIHRMLESIGHRVQRLSRVSFAGIEIGGIKPGEFRVLGATELQKLKRDYLNPSKRAKADAAEEEALAQVAGPLAAQRRAAPPGPNKKVPRKPAAPRATPSKQAGKPAKPARPGKQVGKQVGKQGGKQAVKQASPRRSQQAAEEAAESAAPHVPFRRGPKNRALRQAAAQKAAKSAEQKAAAAAAKQQAAAGKSPSKRGAGKRRAAPEEDATDARTPSFRRGGMQKRSTRQAAGATSTTATTATTGTRRSPTKRAGTKKRAAPAKPPPHDPRKAAQKRPPAKRKATKKSRR